MKIAYADPPYLGQAKKRYADPTYDEPDAHRRLLERLNSDFDGWAYSMGATLAEAQNIIPMLPEGVRLGAWVKPFAIFKPGVNPAYAWEIVAFKPARARSRDMPTVRDWISCNITLKKGLCGAKPKEVCFWIFDVLGAQPGDDFTDLFPGTGIAGESWLEWCQTQEEAT